MKNRVGKPSGGTPVRRILKDTSPLQNVVMDGLGGVQDGDRDYIDTDIRRFFADSLDLDKAMKANHPEENRWDYLLGHRPSGKVIGLEPHSAKEDQVSTVIAKRTEAINQLREHLKPGGCIAAWLWVASERIHFADTEKARRRLDQNGIQFVGTKVLLKHLPADSASDR